MERVTSDERFRAIREAGRGVVYNDFSGRGASGAQYNVVHAASCGWLARSNLTVAKLWFEDLPAATDWLVRERGREGQGWKRCGTCHGAGASGATPRALPPSPRAPAARPRPDAAVRVSRRHRSRRFSGRGVVILTTAIRAHRPDARVSRRAPRRCRTTVGRPGGSPPRALHVACRRAFRRRERAPLQRRTAGASRALRRTRSLSNERLGRFRALRPNSPEPITTTDTRSWPARTRGAAGPPVARSPPLGRSISDPSAVSSAQPRSGTPFAAREPRCRVRFMTRHGSGLTSCSRCPRTCA